MSIGKKIILLITSFIILTLSFTYFSYNIAEKKLVQKIEDMGQVTVKEMSLVFKEYFNKLDNIVDSIHSNIQYILENNNSINFSIYLTKQFENISYNGIQTIFIGLDSGEFYDATNWKPPENYDPRYRSWYIKSSETDKIHTTDPYIDLITQKYIISICKSLYINDIFYGVLGIDIDLNSIYNIITTKILIEETIPFIINNKGFFIISSKKEWNLTENIITMSDNISFNLTRTGKDILINRNGFTNVNYNNNDYILFYNEINNNMIFGLLLPKNNYYMIAKEISNLHLYIGFIILQMKVQESSLL